MAVITAWMHMVAAVANPPASAVMRDARIGAVLQTSGKLPRLVWTCQTRAWFGQKCNFWPSDASVNAFLRPLSGEALLKLRGLRLIARQGCLNEAPAPLSMEARDAVLAKFRRDMHPHGLATTVDQQLAAFAAASQPAIRPAHCGPAWRESDPLVLRARAARDAQARAAAGET